MVADFWASVVKLHENALVAWDRDIPRDIEITSKTSIRSWGISDWASEDKIRHDGIGVVYTFGLFRAVLFFAPEDPLGVRWWLDTWKQKVVREPG